MRRRVEIRTVITITVMFLKWSLIMKCDKIVVTVTRFPGWRQIVKDR
jgi:hypothetical protein